MQAGNVVVLDEKDPHIRNNRDGHSVQAGCEKRCVHHGHVGVSDDTGPVFSWAWTVSGSSVTTNL